MRRSVVSASILTLLLAGGVGWLPSPSGSVAAAQQVLPTARATPPTVETTPTTARTTPTTIRVTTTTARAAPPTSVTPTRAAVVPEPVAPPTTSAVHTPTSSPAPKSTPVAVGSPAVGGCAAALSYLASHSAPGFIFRCPGYALGHQAMTCVNVAGVCPGLKEIVIAKACPATWMNEASNSWVLTGQSNRMIDPYGFCA